MSNRGQIIALTVLLGLLWAGDLAAQSHFKERFDYDVEWGYTDVATVSVRRGCPRNGYVPSRLRATSRGVISQIHAFEVVLDSFSNLSGRTLEGRTFVKEEGVPRKYRTRFSDDGRAVAHKVLSAGESTTMLRLRPPTYDLLSWFFALREADLDGGRVHELDIWDGWKLTRLRGVVGAVERVWTPTGTFEAHKVVLSRVRLRHGGPKAYEAVAAREKIGAVWFSADAARTPVALELKAPVGMTKLRLKSTLRRPCGGS